MSPPSSKPANRPMADALISLREQMRSAQATPAAQTPTLRPATQRPSIRPDTARRKPDPLATIEQPSNPPLPSPLGAALAAVVPQVQARPTPEPQRQPGVVTPPASFANLLREQERKPAPATLQEKLSVDSAMPSKHPKTSSSNQSQFSIRLRKYTYTQSLEQKNTSTKGKTSAMVQGRSLQDLKAMQQARKAELGRQQTEQARAQTRLRQAQAERQAFLQAIGPVSALPDPGKVLHHQPREPIPTQRQLDEQAVLREALSDEFDAGTLLDTDESLSFLRPGVGLDVARKLRRGEWSIQKQVDLHGLRTDEARETLGQFIRECHRAGLRCVRVIHGKGLGSPGKTPVLKSRVRRWLVQKAEVMAFVQANPNQGGDGAVVVLLRSPR